MYIPRSSMDSESFNEKSNGSNSSRPRGERPQAVNESASCCRCSNHHHQQQHQQQQQRETRPSQMENPKRVVEFSAEMLKDQELLVSTLSQQGISEALIRRQFNKLLEEQCKQLALQKERSSEKEQQQQPNGRDRKPISSEARESTPPPLDPRKRSEPSSLLRLRVKRETLDSRSRNNGLQDLVTAAQIIEKSKPDSKTAAAHLRLDGTQDSGAVDPESDLARAHGLCRPQNSSCSNFARPVNVSANGLANSRNFPLAQKSPCQQHCQPGGDAQQQQQQQSRVEVERSNTTEDSLAQMPRDTAQQSASYCPDIQEPKVFGGFTYFARKPQAGCLPQLSPQSHPHVNASRSTTAF